MIIKSFAPRQSSNRCTLGSEGGGCRPLRRVVLVAERTQFNDIGRCTGEVLELERIITCYHILSRIGTEDQRYLVCRCCCFPANDSRSSLDIGYFRSSRFATGSHLLDADIVHEEEVRSGRVVNKGDERSRSAGQVNHMTTPVLLTLRICRCSTGDGLFLDRTQRYEGRQVTRVGHQTYAEHTCIGGCCTGHRTVALIARASPELELQTITVKRLHSRHNGYLRLSRTCRSTAKYQRTRCGTCIYICTLIIYDKRIASLFTCLINSRVFLVVIV